MPSDPVTDRHSDKRSKSVRRGGRFFEDVVRLTFYVTDWAPDRIGAFMAGIESVAAEVGLPQPLPPASLIGVDYLFEPDVLVELEATAITD